MEGELFRALGERSPAFCIAVVDPPSGLEALIVLDDLTLGPAAGGVRTMRYESVLDGLTDAMDLARAMTHKCALAGLAAGGGKAVVLDGEGLDRPRAFEVLGERIERLGGLFRTAGDLGTTLRDLEAMARRTRFVHLEEAALTGAVARGLLRCIEACAARQRRAVPGLRVAVQGCGAIGSAVARTLAEAGAEITVSDIDPERAQSVAGEIGARVVDPGELLTSDADIIAPCARGKVMTPGVAERLRAWAVCGAANNILASPEAGWALRRRGVLFVPDVIASAGAVVEGIGKTVMGLDDRTSLIDRLGETASEVLRMADERDTLPELAATELAKARLEEARGRAG